MSNPFDPVTDAQLHEIGEALGVRYDQHGNAIPEPPIKSLTAGELRQIAQMIEEQEQHWNRIKRSGGGKVLPFEPR